MTTAQARRLPPLRGVLLLPAGLALLAGLDAALLLLGFPAPLTFSRLADVHGYLMTLGFVGTLISLERAVALAKWWGYLSPVTMGLGGLLLLSPVPLTIAFMCSLVGITGMCVNYAVLWRRNRDEAILIQTLGAAVAAIATLLLISGVPIRVVVSWLAVFLILTICGERLELARLTLARHDGTVLLVLSCAIVLTLLGALLWPIVGYPLLGAEILGLTIWLGSRDVAMKLIRADGLRRFMAACMLAGYFWLGVAGAVWLLGPAFEGVRYDAVIHAVFIGFTMSMIMAHASTILPAVLRRPLPYRAFMWVPALLLHVSLLVRLWIGDALGVLEAVEYGGLVNVIALLLFFGTAVVSSILGPPRTAPSPTKTPPVVKPPAVELPDPETADPAVPTGATEVSPSSSPTLLALNPAPKDT